MALALIETFPRHRKSGEAGFTLIELMIVVAIIAVLAAVVIPQFASSVVNSQEAVTKGNLGVIRSALSIYYGDNEGVYPTDINALTVDGRYLQTFPVAIFPPHP